MNEIYGEGNSYTADYWQYDSRLGRRWNVDPKIFKHAYNSSYLCFHNNPILFIDPQGDDPPVIWLPPGTGSYNFAKNYKYVEGNGRIDVFAHGNPSIITYNNGEGTGGLNLRSPEDFDTYMRASSPSYAKGMDEGKKMVIVLHVCATGADYVDGYGEFDPIARQISEKYPHLTIVAADGWVHHPTQGPNKGKETITTASSSSEDPSVVVFKYGKEIARKVVKDVSFNLDGSYQLQGSDKSRSSGVSNSNTSSTENNSGNQTNNSSGGTDSPPSDEQGASKQTN